MIRRRKRDDSAPAPPAPTPPAGVSGEPALGSPPPAVPTADADESPSAAVLDELLAVFGADEPTTLPRRRVDGTEPEAPVAGSPRVATPDRLPTAASDRKGRGSRLGGRRPHDVDPGDECRRARRRRPRPTHRLSCRDPVDHRRPRHAGARGHEALDAPVAAGDAQGGQTGGQARGAPRQGAGQAGAQGRQGGAQGRVAGRPTTSTPARAFASSPPTRPGPRPMRHRSVVTPPGDGMPTAAGTRTVTVIADDDLPDPVYLEGDLAASER